ncbi:multicopper oxidase family protein [Actinoplanes sp. LDG1-06]|uniref:Multicopper oxidase family protein n=1 Tax=Paractinoplanes ovalisporus TaxID=2810368 RepID=A0ABS2A587_9ACTN|nr:multicopper oxidase family protein [Actinoplanes ovalisporus]MBM2614996.1 multicopper oxidase family protein [Actinoplanes ovalisporus]
MYGTLLLIDMTVAVLTLIAAPVGGIQATRRWMVVLAVLAAARLVLALLLLTGGVLLADTRLLIQVPLALFPAAWAVWKPSRTAAHVSAAGGVLSVWWLLAPTAPQDAPFVLAGSAVALALVAAFGRRRLLWLAVTVLLVPGVTLTLNDRANAAATGHQHSGIRQLHVDQLTGPKNQTPDVRVTLVAARGRVTLDSGRTVDALTFNGQSPGPEIRARKGQLVEVTLVNENVSEGVTAHWHGVDVPNAEDGVPGVTQDAVMPGARHVYRFIPTRTGTFWYHTHRDGRLNVRKGLFGALIVEEPTPYEGYERTVFTHAWPEPGALALDRADRPAREAVAAGRNVLLRLVNSSEEPQRVQLAGTEFRVAAIDGNAVQAPTPLKAGTGLVLAAGGRYDVTFTMPAGPVTLAGAADASLAFSPDGAAAALPSTGGDTFDPLTYGSGPAPAGGPYQRTFDLRLDDGFGFSEGRIGFVSSSINGRLYPAVPSLEVDRGDRVRVRIASRSTVDHPFHLHGHRVRVLARNGAPATGSPWWTDTLNVGSGEVYEIEFVADNPGIWMDHCHNFMHASNGMVMHLAYTGVTTPFSEERIPE